MNTKEHPKVNMEQLLYGKRGSLAHLDVPKELHLLCSVNLESDIYMCWNSPLIRHHTIGGMLAWNR